jgi:hypothetical protein
MGTYGAGAHEDSIWVGRIIDPANPGLSRDLREELARLHVDDIQAAVDGIRHEQPSPPGIEGQVVEPAHWSLQCAGTDWFRGQWVLGKREWNIHAT